MGSGGPIVPMQNRTLLSPAIHQMVDAENLTLRPGTNGFRNISLLQLLLSDENAANRAFYYVEFWYERSGTATPPPPLLMIDPSVQSYRRNTTLGRSPQEPLHIVMGIAYRIGLSMEYKRGSTGETADLGQIG